MGLYWYAMNDEVVPRIDIIPIRNSRNLYFLNLPKPQVNFKDTIASDGFSKIKSLTQYQLYPNWTLNYKEHQFKKNNKAIIQYLRDSLRASHPDLTFSNLNLNIKTKLLGIENINENPYSLDSTHNPYWIRFKIQAKLPKHCPRVLENISVVVKSKLLPENRYEYGQCDKFGGFFNKCTTLQYFNSGGGTFNTHYADQYCQVFDMAKGSSHYKCSVDDGA